MGWRERDSDNPDYARMDYMDRQHRTRYKRYVEAHGFTCQACGGRGQDGDCGWYEPAEPCGWCSATGKVTRWRRGLYLRTMRDEKRKRLLKRTA